MKKIMLIITAFLLFVGFIACNDDNSNGGNNPPEPPPIDTTQIDAKVFFATDFHIIVNTPTEVDVFVDDKLIGTLTEPIYKSQLDLLEQYDAEKLYPFLIIFKIDKPQNVKYTFKPKSKSTGDYYSNPISMENELHIDKTGNYVASIIFNEGG
jgi:hypothetical protein